MLTERFATTVEKDHALGTVTTKLIQGPFRALDCKWTITPASAGCSVDFAIDYEFSNPILAALLAANFGKAVGKLMDAFETEAARREGSQ
jgi:coenzyme Q-binding protein COQ10